MPSGCLIFDDLFLGWWAAAEGQRHKDFAWMCWLEYHGGFFKISNCSPWWDCIFKKSYDFSVENNWIWFDLVDFIKHELHPDFQNFLAPRNMTGYGFFIPRENCSQISAWEIYKRIDRFLTVLLSQSLLVRIQDSLIGLMKQLIPTLAVMLNAKSMCTIYPHIIGLKGCITMTHQALS